MVPPAMGRRRANRSAALEPSFYTCLIEGLLEWRGGSLCPERANCSPTLPQS